MATNYIVTENSITVLINNRPEIIDNTHPNFLAVEQALKDGKSENDILVLMNTGKAIEKFVEKSEVARGNIKIENGEIYYMDEVVHSALATRIISLMDNGFDITPFTNFMENLYENPSYRAVNELYGFLEACNLPITEDGHFLAYKKIKHDYTDCYTGKMDNSIGATVSMPRYKVNEDKNQTCSTGLHVASYSYMSSYSGDRIVICKVNPKDVVSVPTDYNNAKMRVCEYVVVNEVALSNEEITPNVISDDEVYSEEYNDIHQDEDTDDYSDHEPMSDEIYDVEECYTNLNDTVTLYDDYEEMVQDVNEMDLNDCRNNFRAFPKAEAYLSSITSSTSFWKRSLIEILCSEYNFENPEENTEEFYSEPKTAKMKFTKTLENYLSDYDTSKWIKLSKFLKNKGLSAGFVSTGYDLSDYSSVIQKLKSMSKNGDFKKRNLLRELGI